ncbi:hypothetical protein Q3G72_019669 [Acer saccharum]|nr:hypothetical protein Q3G72_019669 [Acer saccharum]
MVGIGGVLRDRNGKVVCLFSVSIGLHDSNTAELLAIHKACELCVSNEVLVGRDIEIVSVSKMAVSWVNDEDFGCDKHVQIIYDIRSMISSSNNISVIFNLRTSNSVTNSLAKRGSSLIGDSIVWGEN